MSAQFKVNVRVNQARKKDRLRHARNRCTGMLALDLIGGADAQDDAIAKSDAGVAQNGLIHRRDPVGQEQRGLRDF